MNKLLTIKEIAQALNMPESTTRYYRDKFTAYLPSQKKGNVTCYNHAAVKVIKTISDLKKAGRSWEGIERSLKLIDYGEPVENVFTPASKDGYILSVSFRIMSEPATKGSGNSGVGKLVRRKASEYFRKPLTDDISVTYKFFTHNQRLDIDNMEKLINDSLTGIAWLDDRQIIESHAYKINVADYNTLPHIQINISECLGW